MAYILRERSLFMAGGGGGVGGDGEPEGGAKILRPIVVGGVTFFY